MTSRPTPRYATWFLDQFGPGLGNEAAIGDLIEKYQRGWGRSWYWRQVLSIVFAQLRRDVWRDKWWWLRGMIVATLTQTLLQLTAGGLMRAYYAWSHPRMHQGSTVNLWPLVTFKVGNGAVQQWEAVVPAVILNILILLLIGRLVTLSRRVPPRTMLFSYVTCYALFAIALMGLSLVALLFNLPNSLGFLLISILAVTIGPPLMLLGSCLVPKSPSPSEIPG
jgi:hypothetical protein